MRRLTTEDYVVDAVTRYPLSETSAEGGSMRCAKGVAVPAARASAVGRAVRNLRRLHCTMPVALAFCGDYMV